MTMSRICVYICVCALRTRRRWFEYGHRQRDTKTVSWIWPWAEKRACVCVCVYMYDCVCICICVCMWEMSQRLTGERIAPRMRHVPHITKYCTTVHILYFTVSLHCLYAKWDYMYIFLIVRVCISIYDCVCVCVCVCLYVYVWTLASSRVYKDGMQNRFVFSPVWRNLCKNKWAKTAECNT